MKNLFKRIAILLIVTLLAPTIFNLVPSLKGMTAAEAYAATQKATLGKSKVTIGVVSSPEYVIVNNQPETATYTYSSANKKIATVNEYGFINGVSKGKTTITVKEKNNGTITEIGKISVTVVGPAISKKSVDVGVNNYTYPPINYMNFEAVYKYKSSDTKIATVDEYGGITGLKLGKATISVTETYKGKTTKVGAFTINVTNGKITQKQIEIPVNQGPYTDIPIACRNYEATYKYKSANTKIATVNKDGYVTGVKEGTTTISVTETYNKKTVKVGSIKVKVVQPSLDPKVKSVDIGINSSNSFFNLFNINYYNINAEYTCESADTSIISTGSEVDQWGYENFLIKGVNYGTTTLTVYEKLGGKKRKVGTIKATVKDIPATDLYFYTYGFEEENGKLTKTYYLEEDYSGSSLMDYFSKEPYNSTTPILFTSGDESVVKVSENGVVTPIAEGQALVTVSCGKLNFEIYINVSPGYNEEYY